LATSNRALKRLLSHEEKLKTLRELYEGKRNVRKLEDRINNIPFKYTTNDAANDRLEMNSHKWFSAPTQEHLDTATRYVLRVWIGYGGLFLATWLYLFYMA